jgi:hypothetical protein
MPLELKLKALCDEWKSRAVDYTGTNKNDPAIEREALNQRRLELLQCLNEVMLILYPNN